MEKMNGMDSVTEVERAVDEYESEGLGMSKLIIPALRECEKGADLNKDRRIDKSRSVLVIEGIKRDDVFDFIDIDDDELVYDVKQAVSPTSSRSLDNPDFGNVSIILNGNSVVGCDSKGVLEDEREVGKRDKSLTDKLLSNRAKQEDSGERGGGRLHGDHHIEKVGIENITLRANIKERCGDDWSKQTFRMDVDSAGGCDKTPCVELPTQAQQSKFNIAEKPDAKDLAREMRKVEPDLKCQNNGNRDGFNSTNNGDTGDKQQLLQQLQQQHLQSQYILQLQSQLQSQNLVNLVALCVATPPPYNGLPQNNPFFSSNGISEQLNIVPLSTTPLFYLGLPEEPCINSQLSNANAIQGLTNTNFGGASRGVGVGMNVNVGMGMGVGMGGFGRGLIGATGMGTGGSVGVLNGVGLCQAGGGMVCVGNNMNSGTVGDMETEIGNNASSFIDVDMVNGGGSNSRVKSRMVGGGSSGIRSQHGGQNRCPSTATATNMFQKTEANTVDLGFESRMGATLAQLNGQAGDIIGTEYSGVGSFNNSYQQNRQLFSQVDSISKYITGKRGAATCNERSYSQLGRTMDVSKLEGVFGRDNDNLSVKEKKGTASVLLCVDKTKSQTKSGTVNTNGNGLGEGSTHEKKNRWQLSDPQFKSGYKGVSWNSRMEAWLAFFVENGIRKSKTFSSRKFGFNRAREKAIRYLDARRKGIILTTPPPLSPSKGIYDRIPQQSTSSSAISCCNTINVNTKDGGGSNCMRKMDYCGNAIDGVASSDVIVETANSNSTSASIVSNGVDINSGENNRQGAFCVRLN